MRNSKHALKRLAIALSALLLVSAIGLAQVTVTIPTVTAKVGTSQSIPINVGNLTGQGVVSYQYTITYDPAIVSITAVTAGPLVSGYSAPTVNLGTAGQVKVAGAGTTALSGSGILSYLVATMTGKGTSALTFTNFQFNEGTPAAATTNGTVIVPVLSVKISDISTATPVGGTFTLPITTETVTSLNVLSAQFTVTFDKTQINITGVDRTNTMTAPWTSSVVNTSVPGELKFAGAGSTALTGSGTLINLVGTVVAVGGNSAVRFTAMQYNEGTPAAGGVDGSVTLGAPQKPVLISQTPAASLTTVPQGVAQNFLVRASDPGGSPLTYAWYLNDALQKGPGADSTYSVTFSDAHGTAKRVTVVFTSIASLKDSARWGFVVTGVKNEPLIPSDFVLGQNYPNPFNPTTLISYSLPKEAPVTFEVFNMLGVKVRTLMTGEARSAGTYTVAWDGKNDAGVSMPSGVYLYRVVAGSYLASKKMTLLK